MDYRMAVQNLFELLKFISEEAEKILREAAPNGPDILTLTMEDLNELLPGERNCQVRRHVKGLIDVFLQVFPTVKEEDRQSMDSSLADVMKADPNDPDIPTSARKDLNELQPGAHVDQVQRHIIGLINVFLQMQAGQSMDSSPADVMKAAPNGPDILTLTMEDLNKLLPEERNFQVRRNIMGLINAFLQQEKQVRQSMNSSPDDVMTNFFGFLAGDASPGRHMVQTHTPEMVIYLLQPGVTSRFEVLQFKVLYTNLDKNVEPNITKEMKVHVLIAGETFGTHGTFIQKLKLRTKRCSAESSSVILVFCPVVSRIGTDMEAAMARVTVNKPVILVFMHHCHSPSHMTNITVQPSRSNIVQIVHCAFHETNGLLECQENEQAVKAVRSALLRYVDSHEVPQPKVPRTQPVMVQQLRAAQGANSPNINNDIKLPGKGTDPAGTSFLSKTGQFFSKSNWNNFSESAKSSISRLNPNHNRLNNSSLVKVHMLVAGETFQTHETFMQKLKLQIELCSAESSNVILLFCPVVSQIGTDMDGAMAGVTEDKPVILVFMHHCHNPSHMTNTTVQPTRSNIEQVVHCAFHECTGLLRCQENEQAVADVQAMLMKHK
nr:uncharacterized protein LOC111834260 [Paramormyrops kingsleyae]